MKDGRLVTLTGFAGVGKTRLALEVGAKLLHQIPGGAWFLKLGNIAQPELVPRTVAEALEVRVLPQQMAAEAVFDHLAHRHALLIDNCERIVDAVAEFVDQLLQRAPRAQALATSREGLGVAGERIWSVPPLRVDADQPAVKLFEGRARLVGPGSSIPGSPSPKRTEGSWSSSALGSTASCWRSSWRLPGSDARSSPARRTSE